MVAAISHCVPVFEVICSNWSDVKLTGGPIPTLIEMVPKLTDGRLGLSRNLETSGVVGTPEKRVSREVAANSS